MLVGCYVGFATVGIFVAWYMYPSVLGLDLSADGHTPVTYSQLSNWEECPTWTGFQVRRWFNQLSSACCNMGNHRRLSSGRGTNTDLSGSHMSRAGSCSTDAMMHTDYELISTPDRPAQANNVTFGGNLIEFKHPCDYFTDGKAKASTLSLSVLVAIEMFNALNALSEVR